MAYVTLCHLVGFGGMTNTGLMGTAEHVAQLLWDTVHTLPDMRFVLHGCFASTISTAAAPESRCHTCAVHTRKVGSKHKATSAGVASEHKARPECRRRWPSRVFSLASPVDFGWLFRHCSVVVHHGGAGTSATCARCVCVCTSFIHSTHASRLMAGCLQGGHTTSHCASRIRPAHVGGATQFSRCMPTSSSLSQVHREGVGLSNSREFTISFCPPSSNSIGWFHPRRRDSFWLWTRRGCEGPASSAAGLGSTK